ncbi:NUDIX domain-containing protein [Miniphocaeibacter halophilus]|uniref:NUDIX domain-containing protein n=1 Tax=Miniphocaeibacter halophilus TaxID=2931922 RepID=A0AC61MP06_9FIRM|nr:NUDIX domain-containing protein [Miniphocaeibacter halophilus]QQK07224.1 NUDIX domain-containing protein [Miniphocaeibacter halophilus]
MKEAKFYFKNSNAPKPKKIGIGSVVIIKYNDRYLMECRKDSNLWSFIGGNLEIDETFINCAIRETYEETGLKIKEENLEFFKIYYEPSRIAEFPDGNIVRILGVVYILVLKEIPELRVSKESYKLEFFSKDDLRLLNIAKTMDPILNDILIKKI